MNFLDGNGAKRDDVLALSLLLLGRYGTRVDWQGPKKYFFIWKLC